MDLDPRHGFLGEIIIFTSEVASLVDAISTLPKKITLSPKLLRR